MHTFAIHATVEANTLDGALAALVAALEKATVGADKPDTSGTVVSCSIAKSGAWSFAGGTSTSGSLVVEQ
jgi:hypothetical protein